MSALVAIALVAVVLVAEAGLLVGVLLPAGSLVLGLGVLAGTGAAPLTLVALSVAVATVLGAALGHRLALRPSDGALQSAAGVVSRRLPAPAGRLLERMTVPWREAIGRRPVLAAATAQFVAGARTLAPRLAATGGVPVATMLRGTVPAALVWAGALVTSGALAGAALPLVRDVVTAAGVLLLAGVIGGRLLLRRRVRSRAERSAQA
jgi:membrane-associated protein